VHLRPNRFRDRFTEEWILGILREVDLGAAVADVPSAPDLDAVYHNTVRKDAMMDCDLQANLIL
jgi:hypothetical protein